MQPFFATSRLGEKPFNPILFYLSQRRNTDKSVRKVFHFFFFLTNLQNEAFCDFAASRETRNPILFYLSQRCNTDKSVRNLFFCDFAASRETRNPILFYLSQRRNTDKSVRNLFFET